MNPKIFKTLEWSKITRQVAEETTTTLGEQYALALQPMTTHEAISDALDAVAEMQELSDESLHLPIGAIGDVQVIIKRLEINGSLSGKELAMVLNVLKTSQAVVKFFKQSKVESLSLTHLTNESAVLELLPEVRHAIAQVIDEDGNIYDDASGALQAIRREIKRKTAEIRTQLDRIMRAHGDILTEAIVTIRNERFVLPVQQSYRHALGGTVHDQSASGQTLYIEPGAVQSLNDRVQQLRNDEREEIARLLLELSQQVAPYHRELAQDTKILGVLDLIRAKARLAAKQHATKPVIAADGRQLHFNHAMHPLLDPQKAVRNDIYFDNRFSMLIVTGPNTGGKTITLKTIGLLQLMGQAGLYITAGENSQIGVFEEIYADIGDEQSIEANLSTFSGHMTNIIQILETVTSHDLVLLDELGAGTDPKEGAALGIAILNRLDQREAMVATTTHYPELKAYAFEQPHSINASVAFDEETLAPTYRLLIGEPGKSNALDISKRLGLADELVEEARGYLDQNSRDLTDMIDDLDQSRADYETRAERLADTVAQSEKLLHDLNQVYSDLQAHKENYLHKAKQEANAYVERTKDKATKIIGEIREWQRERPNDQPVKEHEMIDKQQALDALYTEEDRLKDNKVLQKAKRERKKQETPHQFQKGDQVEVIPYGQTGTLVDARENGKEWVVQMGVLKMQMATGDLKYIPKKSEKAQKTTIRASKAKHVKPEIDLRGLRYNDAMHQLDTYIDQALLANYAQVTIIHGFGTGAIKNGVQDYLKQNKRVKAFHYAPHNQGGNGATIAELNR
ncbi:MAG: endonuclease MutS2 [Aerococcus sp.]|nr:endonuclease MutS2 [Aerococcus sp.]